MVFHPQHLTFRKELNLGSLSTSLALESNLIQEPGVTNSGRGKIPSLPFPLHPPSGFIEVSEFYKIFCMGGPSEESHQESLVRSVITCKTYFPHVPVKGPSYGLSRHDRKGPSGPLKGTLTQREMSDRSAYHEGLFKLDK